MFPCIVFEPDKVWIPTKFVEPLTFNELVIVTGTLMFTNDEVNVDNDEET